LLRGLCPFLDGKRDKNLKITYSHPEEWYTKE